MLLMILSLVPWSPVEIKKETNFQYAYKILLEHEGNYVNHPDDKGKETYRGISRRYNQHWYGWRYIDKIPNKQRYQDIEKANFWAQDYFLDIWIKEGWDRIIDKRVAAYLFDYRINAYFGVKEIKKALWKHKLTVSIDNKFTPEYAELINLLSTEDVLNTVQKARWKHYHRIAAREESQKQFLKHWLHRTKLKPMR